MKSNIQNAITQSVVLPGPKRPRQVEVKRPFTPQPSGMTREEMKRLIIEMIG